MMYAAPELFSALLGKLAEVVRRYLLAQIEAGAQAVQLFDSWVGALYPADYERYVLPHVKHILRGLPSDRVPVIHFGTGTSMLLELQREAGGTALGIDWRTPLDVARARLGSDVCLQGNLDPLVLHAPRALLRERVRDVLDRAGPSSAHVFNLGHGILPDTDPDAVKYTADIVHELSSGD
jgi:uroporphyrinogen decarboxylase